MPVSNCKDNIFESFIFSQMLNNFNYLLSCACYYEIFVDLRIIRNELIAIRICLISENKKNGKANASRRGNHAYYLGK
jgi:hypothetical protein